MSLRTRHFGGHLMRGLVGVVSMVFFFLALVLLPLADAIALGLFGPIFMTALSVPLLGESVGPPLERRHRRLRGGGDHGAPRQRRFSADGPGRDHRGPLLRDRDDPGPPLGAREQPAIVFYFTLFATVVGRPRCRSHIAPPGSMPGLAAASWPAILVAIGLIGGVAQFTMTEAFRRGRRDHRALRLRLWSRHDAGHCRSGATCPMSRPLIGAAIVVASGIYIVHRER